MAAARRAAAATPPGAPDARGLLGQPLLHRGFLEDPYPTYAALRHAAPLVWSDEFFGGAWLVSRHADVDWVLRDARFSAQRTGGWVMATTPDRQRGAADRSPRAELRGFQRLFARAMIFLDAPDHARVRQTMAAAFRPADMQHLVPGLELAIRQRLDAVDASQPFDFVAALARPLPAQVIGLLMGLDAADANSPAIVGWSDELAAFIGAPDPTHAQALDAQAALLAMAAFFEVQFTRRRAARAAGGAPRDDVIGRLIEAEQVGVLRGAAELLAQCVMLLFAGHETTRHLLANGLRTLLAHPAAWQQLQAEPALMANAVRELLRFDSPVQYTGRRVAADLTLHGHRLRRGDLVVALIGAANRDPARFDQPDAIDLTRRASAPLAFGQGPHVCIGAALTLMEAQAVFSHVITRWPALTLAQPQVAHWTGNALYRGVTALPLHSGSAARGRGELLPVPG